MLQNGITVTKVRYIELKET